MDNSLRVTATKINWRKPKLRRRGELNGRVDWDKAFKRGVWILILAALLWAVFTWGYSYANRQSDPVIAELKEEIALCKGEKISGKYGPLYPYIEYRGEMYYVRNPKDIDNPAKWIKTGPERRKND